MKITNDYVEFVTTTGIKTRINKKDDPSLFFRMSCQSEDQPFGSSFKQEIQEDYSVWEESY